MKINNNFIRMEITNRCNLQCENCFSLANHRMLPDIPLTNVLKLAQKYKILGAKTILLTGGECTLLNELEYLLYELKMLDYNVCIFTNGSVWNKKQLIINRNYIDKIYVSLDHENFNDSRGHIACRNRTIDFIEELDVLDFNYCIETIVDQNNYTNLSWITDFANKFNVQEWIIGSKYIGHHNTLSEAQEVELLDCIEKIIESLHYRVLIRSNIISREQFMYCDEMLDDLFTPYIHLDGTIKPFFLLNDNSYDLMSIEQLLHTAQPQYHNLYRLEQLKKYISKKVNDRKCWDFTELIYEGVEFYDKK